MSSHQTFAKGRFSYKGDDGKSVEFFVDFNPASLDYSISINTKGEGGQTQQVAGAPSATLNMELIFDTTDSGDDVRAKTNQVEVMLRPREPSGGSGGPPKVSPMVTFEWGAFSFTGIVDTFKQTMDFFSAEGVPLRAVTTLSMSQPDYQFDQRPRDGTTSGNQALVVGGGNPSQLAADAGNPFAARAIASVNGLESLRASVGASVAVGSGVTIGAPAGFSAGAGVSLGGAVGGGAGAGFSAGFGAGASAGVAAGAGAFGGLHASTGPASSGGFLSPQRLLATTSAPAIAPGASFDVSGKAISQGASTFKSDVGATRRVRFDES